MKTFAIYPHEMHTSGLSFKSNSRAGCNSLIKSVGSSAEPVINEAIKQIMSSHSEVIDGTLGKVKGHQAVVHLCKGVQAIVHRAPHPVEFALQNGV